MDKNTLNNEVNPVVLLNVIIVLCRAAVRKAKVAVIRKILKKMKILKACKTEHLREKKLKKSERLFEKVQIMKKVKLDEVTKFALKNKDLQPFLNGPKVNSKDNAVAHLAQHDAVSKKINSIREKFPNWETELPLLLDSLGRKKRKPGSKKESTKTISDENIVENSEKVVEKEKVNGIKKEVKNVKGHPEESRMNPGRTEMKDRTNDESVESEESDSSVVDSVSNSSEKTHLIKKIVDPFFIGKTVIAPKLSFIGISEMENQDRIRKAGRNSFQRKANFSRFHSKANQSKKDSDRFRTQVLEKVSEEENLHPSWAAKKVKLIKPFQGKKIKFSED